MAQAASEPDGLAPGSVASRPARYDEAMNLPGKDGSPRDNEGLASRGRRVAFFGGSFDPPHLGHLAVARAARAAFALDAVLFAPVGMQPLKPDGPAASFENRLAMTRLAIAGEPGFEVSLADAPKTSGAPKSPEALNSPDAPRPAAAPNYTIDTLQNLRASFSPESTLFCLMGADSFFGLRHWHRAAEIPFVAQLIVASRPGQPLDGLTKVLPSGLRLEPAPEGDKSEAGVEVRAFVLVNEAANRAPFYVLPGLNVEIAASEIRAQIQAARGAESGPALLPAAVRNYIAEHKLYGS